jgi:hypothetical protein
MIAQLMVTLINCFDLAARNGDTNCCLEHRTISTNPVSVSQLSVCAEFGRLDYLRFILETIRLPVDGTNVYDEMALYKAYEGAYNELITLLYKHGASPFITTVSGANLLHAVAAAVGDQVIAMESLIDRFRQNGTLEAALNAKHRYDPSEDCGVIAGRTDGRVALHSMVSTETKSPANRLGSTYDTPLGEYGVILTNGWGLASPPGVEQRVIQDKRARLDTTYPLDRTPIHIQYTIRIGEWRNV